MLAMCSPSTSWCTVSVQRVVLVQAQTLPGSCGSKNSVMVCAQSMKDLRKWKQDDGTQKDFDWSSTCSFRVCCNKSADKDGKVTFKISPNSNVKHTALCGAKSRMTKGEMLSSESFVNAVSNNKGASSKSLGQVLMQEEKVPHRSQDLRTLQRARSEILSWDEINWSGLWEALPHYLDELQEKNPGSHIILETHPDNTFKRLFVMLKPVVDMLKLIGRKVSGHDFCHSRHTLFGGMYANSTFQLGRGTLIELFSAVFDGA